MKKQKLKLDELKVQSFVTDFDKSQNQTQEINGGASLPNLCIIYTLACPILTTTINTRTKSWAGCPITTTTPITKTEITQTIGGGY